MKRWFNIFISLMLFLVFEENSFSFQNKNIDCSIKLAVVDRLKSVQQDFAAYDYKKNYMNGINLAVKDSKKRNINILLKIFFYDSSPLSVYSIKEGVSQYNPDAIIGPRWSDQLIIFSSFLQNILVVSPYATSSKIESLGENVYSISPSNYFSSKAIFYFVKKKLKSEKVVIFTQMDCENCVDLSEQEKKIIGDKIPYQEFKFVTNTLDSLDINMLKKIYSKNTTILLFSNGYASGILIKKVINLLKTNDIIFLGGDDWGSFKDWDVGKLHVIYPYKIFHIISWSLDSDEIGVVKFKNEYFDEYGYYPDNVSLAAYQSVMSIINSFLDYGYCGENKKNIVLNSFLKAKKLNENWFRPYKFYIYSVSEKNEKFIMAIDYSQIKELE